MKRDTELPNGLQDVDLETASLEHTGNIESMLKKRGICTHGWTKSEIETGQTKCLYCGKVGTAESLYEERRRRMDECL